MVSFAKFSLGNLVFAAGAVHSKPAGTFRGYLPEIPPSCKREGKMNSNGEFTLPKEELKPHLTLNFVTYSHIVIRPYDREIPSKHWLVTPPIIERKVMRPQKTLAARV